MKFGLPYPPWTNSIRFVSLTLNTWSSDQRSLKERLKDPKVLDIGWTEITGVGSFGKRDLGTSVHIRVKENLMLGNLGSKRLVIWSSRILLPVEELVSLSGLQTWYHRNHAPCVTCFPAKGTVRGLTGIEKLTNYFVGTRSRSHQKRLTMCGC